ncbi:pyridoxine 5'-phosphate synthase [Candidatus Omnitrophota bacterium]
MPLLGVNIDHVATLRQARKGKVPEPVAAACICESAGADSIVVHLRQDRRHINDKDVYGLREAVKTRLNLEMSTYPEIVDIACAVKPNQATLVPEKRQELTTEGGLNVVSNLAKIKDVASRLKQNGVTVSLFIDPQEEQIDASLKAGVDMIELHTGRYADAAGKSEEDKYFREIESALNYALGKGMTVNAGHGLDYSNTARIAAIVGLEELNIGYSIVCRAVFTGLERAVKEMKKLTERT